MSARWAPSWGVSGLPSGDPSLRRRREGSPVDACYDTCRKAGRAAFPVVASMRVVPSARTSRSPEPSGDPRALRLGICPGPGIPKSKRSPSLARCDRRSMSRLMILPRGIRPGRSNGRGVTALELIMLVALMVILAAIAIPGMSPVVLNGRLRGGAWQLAGDLRLARQMAVTTQKRHRICLSSCTLTVGSGWYSLEREEGTAPSTFWVSAAGGAATRLPTDVTVSVNTTGDKLTFDEKGMASPGTFILSNLAGSYNVIIGVTGRVRICNPAIESCS